MELASIRTSTLERVGSCSSKSNLPVHFAKRPCTLEMTRWRTQKWMAEWLVSMSHVFVAMVGVLCWGRLAPVR